MKKISTLLGTVVAFAAVLSSCSKAIELNEQNQPINTENEVLLTIKATSEKTKTYIDGTAVKWASTGEYLAVFEVATPTAGDAETTKKVSAEGVPTDGGVKMTFGVSMPDKSSGYSNFDYYAFYPDASLNGHSGVNAVKIDLKAAQVPTATSFDPTADLLIGEPVKGKGSQQASINMRFTRAVAVGKMTITNLPTSDIVKEVRFSANDGSAVTVAGRTNFDLDTATPVSSYGSNTQDKELVLDYSALSLTANTSMDVFFTCFPFELAAGNSFTVIVKTDTHTYTRTVTLTGAQTLAFKVGQASRFTVDMSTAVPSVNAQDIPYAILTYNAAVAAGLSGSYETNTLTDIVGGKWEWNAFKSVGIQLKNGATTSYIKTPVFKDDIRKVVITVSADYSGKDLRFDSTSSSNGGDIRSLTLTSATEYVIDFEAESISAKTFYLHASGAAVNISSIEVYAGTDESVKLATPTGVSAALTDNGSGGTIANSITVSWTAVDHADYYTVTLTPTPSGDPVNSTVNTNTATIAGLSFETEFVVAVVAHANNKGLYTASNAGTCSNITTGAGAIDYSIIYTSGATIAAGSNSSAATVVINANNYDAIKAGSGSKAGVATVKVPSGSTKLHVHIAGWNGDNNNINVTPTEKISKINGATTKSITNVSDSGISGSGSTFTLAGTTELSTDYYFVIDLTGITSETTITFTAAQANKNRFVLWGCNTE